MYVQNKPTNFLKLSSKKLKIVLLSASCRGGGAERVQITLAKSFLEIGHEVHFVAIENDGALLDQIPKSASWKCFNQNRVAKAIWPLKRFLNKEKPDVIIAAMAHVGIVAILSKMVSSWSGKVVIRIDGSLRYFQKSKRDVKNIVLNVLQKLFFSKAYAVVAVSNILADELRQDFGLKNCHVIHNPVDFPDFSIVDEKEINHPFFKSGEPILIAIGRLTKEKGFLFLLDVFAKLKTGYDIKLIILGQGPEKGNIDTKISLLGLKDHVSLPGFVKNPFGYLKNSDVFVMSSESESFGLAIVEALSMGMPVVSTVTAGSLDIVNSKNIGELVRYGDVTNFVLAIERALTLCSKDCQIRITRAKDFAPNLIVSQYIDLIEGQKSLLSNID